MNDVSTFASSRDLNKGPGDACWLFLWQTVTGGAAEFKSGSQVEVTEKFIRVGVPAGSKLFLLGEGGEGKVYRVYPPENQASFILKEHLDLYN